MNDVEKIRVRVNGKERDVPGGLSVRGLLEALDLRPGMVVVELNKEILARDTYEASRVEEGDSIELVHFVGGG